MSTHQKDTEPSIFLRFHVNQNKCDSFLKMFAKTSGIDPLESLAGLSNDSGDMHMVFTIPVYDIADLHSFTKDLHNIFLKLYGFYPAISEKPSDNHALAALHFVRDMKTTKNHANHMTRHLANA